MLETFTNEFFDPPFIVEEAPDKPADIASASIIKNWNPAEPDLEKLKP